MLKIFVIDDKENFLIYFKTFCFWPSATKELVPSVTSKFLKERVVTASTNIYFTFPHAVTNP